MIFRVFWQIISNFSGQKEFQIVKNSDCFIMLVFYGYAENKEEGPLWPKTNTVNECNSC